MFDYNLQYLKCSLHLIGKKVGLISMALKIDL